MEGMDPDGYWYKYLAARHDFDIKLGVFLLLAASISLLTGKTLVKYRGIVSESADPKTFWQSVIILLVFGIVFIGLYFFGPS
jgi:hypothetical protein